MPANSPDPNPTPAQIEAGNYRKGHVKYQGLDISVENLKGSIRSGVDPNGKKWSCILPADYGYIKGTLGADKDHVDVYIGPHKNAFMVWVVNQRDLSTNTFDEHKCMLGFKTKNEAITTYAKGFSDGKGLKRIMSVKSMTMPDFKQWLKTSTQKKAFIQGYFDKMAQAPYGYQGMSMQRYMPIAEKRELTDADNAEIEEKSRRWIPKIFISDADSPAELLSSPGKHSLMAGATAGLLAAPLAGIYTNSAKGGVIGGTAAGLLTALIAYHDKKRRNRNIIDRLRRIPAGGTIRDYNADPLVQAEKDRAIERSRNAMMHLAMMNKR